MSDEYRKLSEIPPLAAPTRRAHVVVVEDGVDYLVPLEAITDIDPAITSKADLDALNPQPRDGTYKRFYNPARDKIEFWRRDAGKWIRAL